MTLLIICLTIVAIAWMLKPERGCDREVYAEFMSGKRGLGSEYGLDGKPLRNK